MTAFDAPLLSALNFLLDREPWARERLAPFTGAVVELRAPALLALRLSVGADGRAAAAEPLAEAAAVLDWRPPEGFAASGEPRLAQALLDLARHLRWEVEEDLSRLIGDAAAHRLIGIGKTLLAWQAEGARRLAEGVLDYAANEKQLLLQRAEFDALAADIARLLSDLERLERRVDAHE